MAPESKELLKDIQSLVKKETSLMRDMLSLDGLLSNIINRKRLPVKPLREYCVETLYL
jgi:hypothetical protein